MLGVLAAASLASCNTAGSTAPEARALGRAAGLVTEPGAVAPFVSASRPADEDRGYIPVGRQGTPRPVPVRDPDSVKALETELDAVHARTRAFAGRPVPGSPQPRPPRAVAQQPQPDTAPVPPARLRALRRGNAGEPAP